MIFYNNSVNFASKKLDMKKRLKTVGFKPLKSIYFEIFAEVLAVDLLGDFLGEVFFTFFKAVALHHTNEAINFDFCTKFLGN